MSYYNIAEFQRTSANQFIMKRGAGYVPNNIVNSLSRRTHPLGDTSDPIQRDTVIEEIERRFRGIRCSSLPRMRRIFM